MKKITKYIAYIISIYYVSVFQFSHAKDTNVELGRVNIELSGVVTTTTCGVLNTEQEKYIHLGMITSQSLSSIGSKSTPVPIHFEMSNCPPNGTVTIMFDGRRDRDNRELLAIDNVRNKAENVAIEISNQDKKRLALGKKSEPFTTDNEGRVSALFYANYYVTKSQIEAGIANANAEFSIEYD